MIEPKPDNTPDNMSQDPISEPLGGKRHVWLKRIGAAVSLSIVAFSLVVLVYTISSVNWQDVRTTFAATGWDQIALSGLLTASSYLALTGYDVIALRQLALKVPYRTAALASFTSYAISFTLGFPLITAGTVRYWIYSQAKVSAGRVASLTIIAGVTFWLGMGLVMGLGLILEPAAIAEINHLKVWVNVLLGVGVLTAVLAYLVWVSVDHRSTRVQGLKLELPGFSLTSGQLALGVFDLCSAAGALYVLLPKGHGLDFLTFASTYVFACILGIASNVPGGIGAFEVTMLQAVPSPSQGALFASLLLFRVLYYFIPFLLAMAMLGAHEIMRRWKSLREDMIHSIDDDAT